jgi:hypothetical protein
VPIYDFGQLAVSSGTYNVIQGQTAIPEPGTVSLVVTGWVFLRSEASREVARFSGRSGKSPRFLNVGQRRFHCQDPDHALCLGERIVFEPATLAVLSRTAIKTRVA